MTVPVFDLKPAPPDQPRADRRAAWFVVAVVAGLVAAVALVVSVGPRFLHGIGNHEVPTFASLATQPDSSLHGTVAYYDSGSGCIRLVAAAGQPSRDLWCLPAESTSTWETLGKPVGPQLVWRPDGRLEVTMFRMRVVKGGKQGTPLLDPGWQKLINVRTGAIESVPATRLPTEPNTTSQPTTSASGQKVSYTFDQGSGRATVSLSDRTGTRTLLSVQGPGEYTYRFGPVFWAPNGEWIAASDDSRILVITTGTPSVTRVLVTGTGEGAGGGTAGPEFAVTSADLLIK